MWGRVGLQVGVLLIAGLLAAALVGQTADNLSERGLVSGFDFLREPAGYQVPFTLIDHQLTDSHGRIFLIGALNTLLVSVLGIIGASVIGVLLGLARLSPHWLLKGFAALYVDLTRNVPLVLHVLLWYAAFQALPTVRDGSLELGGVIFLNNRGLEIPRPVFEPGFAPVGLALLVGLLALGVGWRFRRAIPGSGSLKLLLAVLLGIGLPLGVAWASGVSLSWEIPKAGRFNFSGGISLIPAFGAMLMALTLYTAGFIAEIVRGGLVSVARGQGEAALALGLSPGESQRLVVLPQALRVIVPPLTSQYLNLTKNSSLGIVIGYPDLMATFGSTSLSQTGQAIETIFLAMVFYLGLSLLLALVMDHYNRSVRLRGR